MNKTCYLAGSMEYSQDEGTSWRIKYKEALKKYGINCIIPNEEEKKISHNVDIKKLKKENIEKYIITMRDIIKMDLSLIDTVDMLIVKWDGEVSTGTTHEVGYAYQLGKPVYLISSVPVCDIPGWFLACFTEIFPSFEEILLFFERCRNTVFVVDIDGTVCDSIGRIKKIYHELLTTSTFESESWWNDDTMKKFLQYDEILKDEIISGASSLISIAERCNAKIIFLTGRNECAREPTRMWLTEKFGMPEHIELIMRPIHMRNGYTADYKEQMFKEHVLDRHSVGTTYIFFEDDLNIVKRYSKYGLVLKAPECWQNIGDNI